MNARELALQNFTIANHLLDLHQLFSGLSPFDPGKDFELAVCSKMNTSHDAVFHHTKNERVLCCVKATLPLPSCLLADQGMNFLLRQAILVAAAALEAFFWDVLRENTLTVIQAKGRKTDESLRNITLTLDDYLSLEEYQDKDERLRQIILKRFERGTLYELDKITEIAQILGVRDLWDNVSKQTSTSVAEIRTKLQNLITRRNLIVHRADRPEEPAQPDEVDRHGLRKITYAWANTHVNFAKSFVTASSEIFEKSIEQMNQIIARKTEQLLAQQTLKEAGNT